MLSINAKSLSICCTMLTSVIKLTVASSPAATTTLPSSPKNFVLASSCLPWSPSAKLGCPHFRCCCRCCCLAWPPVDSNDVFCCALLLSACSDLPTQSPTASHDFKFSGASMYPHGCRMCSVILLPARLSSLLTRRTLNLFDVTSSCSHKFVTPMCFILPISCRWRMCSVAFAPNAAAYSSASALLLAMILCFLVYASNGVVPRARLPRLTISSILCL